MLAWRCFLRFMGFGAVLPDAAKAMRKLGKQEEARAVLYRILYSPKVSNAEGLRSAIATDRKESPPIMWTI